MTVAVPPGVVAGMVMVLGVLPVTVTVVVVPALMGPWLPEDAGTATMTVWVPPGVAGCCVTVPGVVKPWPVTVMVVVATGVGVGVAEAEAEAEADADAVT
jgi:hypothetical protein